MVDLEDIVRAAIWFTVSLSNSYFWWRKLLTLNTGTCLMCVITWICSGGQNTVLHSLWCTTLQAIRTFTFLKYWVRNAVNCIRDAVPYTVSPKQLQKFFRHLGFHKQIPQLEFVDIETHRSQEQTLVKGFARHLPGQVKAFAWRLPTISSRPFSTRVFKAETIFLRSIKTRDGSFKIKSWTDFSDLTRSHRILGQMYLHQSFLCWSPSLDAV